MRAGHTWTIREVDFTAIEATPIVSASVEFYSDSSGTPGSPVSIQTVKAVDGNATGPDYMYKLRGSHT